MNPSNKLGQIPVKELTPVYRLITNAADALVALGGENATDVAGFITKLNAEIMYKK